MDDTLRKGNQEERYAGGRTGRRTAVQQVERWETEARLLRRRLTLERERGGQTRMASGVRAKANAPVQSEKSVPTVKTARTARTECAVSPVPKAGAAGRIKARAAALREKDETVGPLHALFCAAQREIHLVRVRLRRLKHQQKNCYFPESDHLPVQLLLFSWGMLPMLASRIRERTWGRRKHAISRFGRIRAWFERKRGHPAVFLASAGAIAVLALFFSFYTIGTTVTYEGNVVAKVSSELAARDACRKLENVTQQALGTNYAIDASLIHYDSGLMPRKDVVDGTAFEEELSGDIGLVTYGYALYVDGEMVGATPYEGALEELLKQLKAGITDANTVSCDFQEAVEVKAGYVPSDKIMNLGYLAQLLYSTKTEEATYTVQKGDTWSEIAEAHDMTSSELLAMNPGYNVNRLSIGEILTLSAAVPYLTLTVTEREQYVDDVPYEIEYVDSAYLYKGDTKVLSAGADGAADVVANVTYVNGEETQRTILSYVTLVNPVTETQARGTKARPTWAATGSFRWPCSGHVTSRFGYRNLSYSYASKYHEGIDIANRRGTTIGAADGGTVTYAGWMSGYGYLVRINHGNGYETYYGHNSKILVSVGQHVYKGQQIAKMGSTGNSTGNHCHFGVYYHGVAKNPMNYLP